MHPAHASTQQKGLLDALAQAGWEFAAVEELHEWWADDVWRMRSVWSPQNREFYLTFIIDPTIHLHRQRKRGELVWAVIASATLPTTRHASEGQFELNLGHGWAKGLSKFVSDVAVFRQDLPDQQASSAVDE